MFFTEEEFKTVLPVEETIFEGPEKTLEVCFAPGIGSGCRALKPAWIDEILGEARCSILSKVYNDYVDAYVLSESSLFVYNFKWVIKTCGRTTLLRCLSKLLEFTSQLEMRLEWVGYSRKNYVFPDEQPSPHTSFHEELNYLKSHQGAAFDGSGYVLGPVTGDHWFVYVADRCERPTETATERTMNVMMFDLADDVRRAFYLGDGESEDDPATAKAMTKRSGLTNIVGDHSLVDARAFKPCGYSMNSLVYGSYYTVHVTPEPDCSYASFETNTPLQSYTSLLKNVITVFKPRRVVVTLFADAAGLVKTTTFDSLKSIQIPRLGIYAQADFSSLRVETDCVCMMANYVLEESDESGDANTAANGRRPETAKKPRPRKQVPIGQADFLRKNGEDGCGLDGYAPDRVHVGSMP